jgi:tetratricopeptide (TPR) repeat protein
MLLRHGVAALGLVIWLVAAPADAVRAEAAAELIEQARQYDCGYTASPEASQRKALDIYRQALAANPDPPQRLQILFRMAQLQSCAYRVQNGEAPNYPQALRLYEEIVATYSSQEPLVLQATTAVADCLISLRRFDEALPWSRRALQANTKALEDQIKALEEPADREGRAAHTAGRDEPGLDSETLRRRLRQMRQTQCAAVDQIAYAAEQTSFLWAEGQLKSIEEQYAGTPVARRARALLDRNADRVSDALAPSRHIPLAPEAPMLQSPVAGVSVTPGSDEASLSGSLATEPPATAGPAPAPGQTGSTHREPMASRAPRGPPRTRVGYIVTGAAGLLIAVLAARWFLTRLSTKGTGI